MDTVVVAGWGIEQVMPLTHVPAAVCESKTSYVITSQDVVSVVYLSKTKLGELPSIKNS